MKTFNKGQSTVEYIVLVALVMSVLIVFLSPQGGPGTFKKKLKNVYSQGADAMEDQAETLFGDEDSKKKKKKK